jgi:hypothetical protein
MFIGLLVTTPTRAEAIYVMVKSLTNFVRLFGFL